MATHREPPPWAAAYGDDNRTNLPAPFTGAPNVGGYSMAAATGMVELAHDLLLAAGVGSEAAASTAAELGQLLLSRADELQAKVRRRSLWVHARAVGEHDDAQLRDQLTRMDLVDRVGSSHVRARGALRTVLSGSPLPQVADSEGLTAWLDEVSERAYVLLAAGHDLAFCSWDDAADATKRVVAALGEVVPTST